MTSPLNKINISIPINQLTLYGYDDYFKSFINLYNKNKLPQVILLYSLQEELAQNLHKIKNS